MPQRYATLKMLLLSIFFLTRTQAKLKMWCSWQTDRQAKALWEKKHSDQDLTAIQTQVTHYNNCYIWRTFDKSALGHNQPASTSSYKHKHKDDDDKSTAALTKSVNWVKCLQCCVGQLAQDRLSFWNSEHPREKHTGTLPFFPHLTPSWTSSWTTPSFKRLQHLNKPALSIIRWQLL